LNAVEIEEAVSSLALQSFDATEFPFLFLAAFDNKETTIRRLRKGDTNSSDIPGGVLQRSNVHLATCAAGTVPETLRRLRESEKTHSAKARYILATDGVTFEAEDLVSGDAIACAYEDFSKSFGFFLPLARISTVTEIKNNPIDIKATGRLNKLYIELLRENPDWGTPQRGHDMNHFMARLIFCYFAEDTGIFNRQGLFTATIEQMTERDSSNTAQIMSTLFRAMNLRSSERAGIPQWADAFPYVNGGLFSGSAEVPRFSRIARSYLISTGSLDWKEINPDIFGSMIQAVTEDEERDSLGMHYTSVPNILKVLNPLFLDELRSQLETAGDNARMLLHLRKRLAKIRVFDPACGSGNFLVIAYMEMRGIEAEINRRRNEAHLRSEIPLTNFRGIELRDFPAEIARLALIIAEYQCDVRYRGQKEALDEFLPLDEMNWITRGNALQLDWRSLCPPTGITVEIVSDTSDLFEPAPTQPRVDFTNEGGETYICGNPQFKGARRQTPEQKEDMSRVFRGHKDFQDCDYVTAWYIKAAEFIASCNGVFAFVSTSSISEGEQVAHLWSRLYAAGCHIHFAHRSFKWRNNAAHNAVVSCVIIGVGRTRPPNCTIYADDTMRKVTSISPYLIEGEELYVQARVTPLSAELGPIVLGSMPRDDGQLLLTQEEATSLLGAHPAVRPLVRRLVGTEELVHFRDRYCLWIEGQQLELANSIPEIAARIENVRKFRLASPAKTTRGYASIPHMFAQRAHRDGTAIVVGCHTSENRTYFPADFLDENSVVSNAGLVLYRASLWEFAIISSKLHLAWITAVCGKLETRLRYSATLGWNTFPIPPLYATNKEDLSRCAEEILLTREGHFPATLAELYEPVTMPDDLRRAHEQLDEVLERVYIGRRFKNDTERIEKLMALYARMSATAPQTGKKKTKRVQ
jgi:hypothetical protein